MSEDILEEAREQFKVASEYWQEDREAALDDLKFRAGKQWPDAIQTQRERDKRPCLTVDKLSQYVRQIVNDGRQNRPSIKVRPVDSGADVPTAEVMQGLIKHIEDQSNADAAYDTALDSAATCGFGYFRVLTDYVHDDTFDQEIYIRRIRNPMSVMIDPNSQEADGSDMKFAFIVEDMPEEDFKAKYPGKTTTDFETDSTAAAWFGETVRVAEYWWVVDEERIVYLLQDGTTVEGKEFDMLEESGLSLSDRVKSKRNIPKRVVKYCKMSGKEFLEEPQAWPGRYIPLLVVWGNEIDIEGAVIHTGIIRPAKDPQRLYNYSRSAFAERVALTPKAPWVAAEGQVEEYEDDWKTANTDNHSVLRYRPMAIGGTQVPPPQRTSASDIPSGFAQDMQLAEHDIQAAIGMYSASLGAPSNERSGKAIMARQKEGDTGTFHYHDNLNRAIRHCGRILVDLIPKIYDAKRIIRTLGYDGTPEQVQLDPAAMTASQKMGMQMVYNLSMGRYDVAISSGPSYNTLRVEAAESMANMVQAQPALMTVVGDLMVKNMDWPGAEEIAARLHQMLPPQILEAEAKSKENKLPPEVQQALMQMEQQLQQKDVAMHRAADRIEAMQEEMLRLKEAHDIKVKEVTIKAVTAEMGIYDAETRRLTAMQPAMDASQMQQLVVDTLLDLAKPNTVELPPDAPPPMETANVAPQATGM